VENYAFFVILVFVIWSTVDQLYMFREVNLLPFPYYFLSLYDQDIFLYIFLTLEATYIFAPRGCWILAKYVNHQIPRGDLYKADLCALVVFPTRELWYRRWMRTTDLSCVVIQSNLFKYESVVATQAIPDRVSIGFIVSSSTQDTPSSGRCEGRGFAMDLFPPTELHCQSQKRPMIRRGRRLKRAPV
jgi:hypothetical protein